MQTQEVTSVARIGLFNRRHTEEQDRPTPVGSTSATDRTVMVDRDRDGVDDRREAQPFKGEADPRDTDRDGIVTPDEARAAHERTQARLAARERHTADRSDRDAGTTAVTDRPAVVERERVVERPVAPPPAVDRDHDGVDDRTQTRPTPRPKIRARASLMATIALMVGLTSVYAALSGRLAPVAVALGVLGLLLSFAGMSASGRPRIAGGGLSAFALLLSVAGAVLGVLAIYGSVSWLDSDVDQVSRLRDWLDTQLPFMSDW